MSKNITTRDSKSVVEIFSEVADTTLRTEQEIRDIVARVQHGEEEAIGELKESYMRFVASLAKQYADKGLTSEELMNAGMDGLTVAAQGFDPSSGFKFIAYAVWYIKQGILLALKACGSPEGERIFNEAEEREEKIRAFDNMLSKGNVPDDVAAAIDSLPSREKEIIRSSYGLGAEPCSDDEICHNLGLTRTKLLQIRSQVMMKLRKQFLK